MIKDITFVTMRSAGTKYDTIKQLPGDALPVSKYAYIYGISSSAYVHVKYDRHKFGYKSKSGDTLHTPHPQYDIVDFHGTCYVINYK